METRLLTISEGCAEFEIDGLKFSLSGYETKVFRSGNIREMDRLAIHCAKEVEAAKKRMDKIYKNMVMASPAHFAVQANMLVETAEYIRATERYRKVLKAVVDYMKLRRVLGD